MGSASGIGIDRVSKVFAARSGAFEALKDVSLSCEPGSFTALIGPSGCGKSTLMHLLGAMVRATSGQVLVDGKDIARMNDSERTSVRRTKIGFVFQKLNLLPTLTAKANIEIARTIQGSEGDPATDSYLAEILKLLKIDEKLERRPSELSGGEQQRFAIARAVSHRPAIVLADEPTGALDSKNSEAVLQMFRELNRKFQQTILLVTHNPELAGYADRLIEMRDGLVVQDSGSVASAAIGS